MDALKSIEMRTAVLPLSVANAKVTATYLGVGG